MDPDSDETFNGNETLGADLVLEDVPDGFIPPDDPDNPPVQYPDLGPDFNTSSTNASAMATGFFALKPAYTHINLTDYAPIGASADGASSVSSAVPPASTTSQAPPPPAASDECNAKYKFFLDTFSISGKNFDPTKLGDNGSGLKKQLDGCGTVTD